MITNHVLCDLRRELFGYALVFGVLVHPLLKHQLAKTSLPSAVPSLSPPISCAIGPDSPIGSSLFNPWVGSPRSGRGPRICQYWPRARLPSYPLLRARSL